MNLHMIAVLLLLFGFGCSTPAQNGAPSCPDFANGETSEDCPWAGIARQLKVDVQEGRSLSLQFENSAPRLWRDIGHDGKNQNLKEFWGESQNYDEYAKQPIIDEPILQALTERFNVSPPHGPENRVVHAGLEHTYGYLFSVLKTPFGFKRARWVRDDLEAGFGLPRGSLGPTPSEGTLLSNVTALFGKIAFRHDPRERARLERALGGVPSFLRKLSVKRLGGLRLIETIRTVSLNTDLVRLPKKVGTTGNTHLLVYSVTDSKTARTQLITGFPVDDAFAKRIAESSDLGPNQPIVTRYNAYVPGVTGVSGGFRGIKKLQK